MLPRLFDVFADPKGEGGAFDLHSVQVDVHPVLAPGLRGEGHLVDSVAHLLNVEGPSDGPVLKDDVDGHLAPAGLGGVHGKREGVSRLCAPGVFLIRDLVTCKNV